MFKKRRNNFGNNVMVKNIARPILDLNKAVGQMTSMTSIRQMLLNLQEATAELADLAVRSEEIGASSHEMADSSQTAAKFVEQSVTTTNTGMKHIEQALSFIENSFLEFDKVSRQVQEVLSSVNNIEQMVSIIAEVAEQTNLLSLNAAIEAARAGEQGKGFAVVADEVRKLAENTKHSVKDIKQNINRLVQGSKSTADSISTVQNTMEQGKKMLHGAGESTRNILSGVQAVSESISQIAASGQEQSAVIQEFSSLVNSLSNSFQSTTTLAATTGRQIYDFSQQLAGMRQSGIEQLSDPSSFDALELAKTDHYLWTWRIYNMLLGYEIIEPEQVGDHHQCRLGRWLESEAAVLLGSSSLLERLEIPHRMVHECAKDAAQAYKLGNLHQAEDLLHKMGVASQEVVSILCELQRETSIKQ